MKFRREAKESTRTLTGINRRQMFPKYVGRYSNDPGAGVILFALRMPS